MAAGVTNPGLVSFPAFMRWLRVLAFLPVWLLVTAEASPTPTNDASPSPTAAPSPSPSPSPQPTPVNAFLSLDVTAGTPDTVINVSGGQFLPNQQMNLYWDQPSKVAGAATADANGSFNTRVKPNPSDNPGVHKLCASVLPNPCANFALQSATPTPSLAPTPSEEPSPTPSEEPTPSQAATPARVNANLSGFDVISRPPFVFLPIFGVAALLLSLAYWAVSAMRRPRRLAPMPTAAVVHRATRPDYSAAFGLPPARPAETPPASAWSEAMQPHSATPSSAPTPPPPAAAEPEAQAYEWGLGTPDSGYPDLRSPEQRHDDDWPDPPQPGD
ncbi:MAG TPA: hypothetical protein VGK28_02925 [Candidatus Dormibacteraeota bacterium]|jgi:hypothetical protein